MKGFFLSFFLLCFAWTGFSAEEVDNGKKPKGKAQTLLFTEDLRFGAEEEDDVYIWSLPSTKVDVDGRGHFFVTDPRESRVLEFDTEGKYVRTVAERGQGPGEFQLVFGFHILMDGRSVGVDLGGLPKFKYFDKDFKYVDESGPTGFSKLLQSATLSPTGAHFGSIFVSIDQANREMFIKTGILDNSFEVVMEMTSNKRPLPDPSRFGDGAYWSEFIGGNMKGLYQRTGVFNFDHQGNVYTAYSNQYEVTRWSPDLKTKELIARREYKPIANNQEHLNAMADDLALQFQANPQLASLLTPQVVRKAIEISEPPPVKNPIFGIIPMENKGFLVIHDIKMENGENTADIFSAEGHYLGQVTRKNHCFMASLAGAFLPKMIFKNGFAYTTEMNEYGEIQVVRFTYKLAPAP